MCVAVSRVLDVMREAVAEVLQVQRKVLSRLLGVRIPRPLRAKENLVNDPLAVDGREILPLSIALLGVPRPLILAAIHGRSTHVLSKLLGFVPRPLILIVRPSD